MKDPPWKAEESTVESWRVHAGILKDLRQKLENLQWKPGDDVQAESEWRLDSSEETEADSSFCISSTYYPSDKLT